MLGKFDKLIAPTDEEIFEGSKGLLDIPPEPISSMEANVGWIHPDGRYYPCVLPIYGGSGHEETAEAIMYHFYSEKCNSTVWGYGELQGWLAFKAGWVRTDIGNDWMMPEAPTPAQIKTLYTLTLDTSASFNRQTAESILSDWVTYLI